MSLHEKPLGQTPPSRNFDRVNLQIFGFKNCKNTKKAEMFFKERRVSYQLINMAEKPMSRGELNSVLASVKAEDLIDREGKTFQSKGLKYMIFDPVEKLLADPSLFKTPVVRDQKRATAGFQPDIWKQWLASK